MANDAGRKILPVAVDEFRLELEQAIPNAVLIKRIAEGLGAFETKLAQHEGQYTDQKHLVNWSERRRYAELAAKLRGLLVERVEIGNKDDQPLDLAVESINTRTACGICAHLGRRVNQATPGPTERSGF